MSILLDPNKDFVSIKLVYVEQKNQNGHSVFHFMQSRQDLDLWKGKGYMTAAEMETAKNETSGITSPGMPQKPTVDESKLISELGTYWTPLTWKDQNAIYARCLHQTTTLEGKTQTELDGISYRDMKLKKCLKKWDHKDDQGQEVPITEMVIDNLVPEVAQELLSNFEQVTELTEDQLKNLK